jgi:DNA-binding MarR family transcriptional regulator
MNEKTFAIKEDLLTYQTHRLQELIAEMLKCCEDRKVYESGKFALPHAELKCLLLFDGQRYLTVTDIAQKLEVAKSRVTKLVNGLKEKKLVEEIDDPKDARIKLISLTPAGHTKFNEITAFQRELYRTILLQVDADERNHVLSSLELLRSAMEAVKEDLV